MEQRQERKTYASRDAFYDLNPAQIFNVVADLVVYLHIAKSQHNSSGLRPAIGLRGDGRRFVLQTDVINDANQPGILTSFDLAELVLSEDNSKLTLATHQHQRVAVTSDYLHHLAKKYQTG